MNNYTLEEKIKYIIENGLSCEICKHHFDCDGHETYSVGGIVHFAPCWDNKEYWVTDDEDEINEVFYK